MHRFLAIALLMVSGVISAAEININTADADTIARELSGIGEARAHAIVAWRKEHGKFTSLGELEKVKGVGSRILQKNRAKIRFDDVEHKAD